MGGDVNYQVVYRGESLESYQEGGWVLFSGLKSVVAGIG